MPFFLKLKLAEFMGSETGRPAGTGDACAAHSSQIWGEPGSSGADLHTHDEIFDLAQGSVIKKQTNQWCHNLPLSGFCACFYFLPAGVTPFLLFLKRINMDQKGWCLFFYVTFSTFAVLCSDAFNSHRFTSVNGWSPDHQFDLLRLFLFTLNSSLRSQSEFGD